MNAIAETCPPLEEIAAFLDGMLYGEERDRFVAHLADCEECYPVFADAARFQLEEVGELKEPTAPDEETPAPSSAAAPVVPFQRKAFARWAFPLAAMLLVGLVTVPLYLRSLKMPMMSSGEFADQATLEKVSLDDFWPTMRGHNQAAILDSAPFEFLVGAHLVDLRLTLARDDVDGSVDFLSRINGSMESLSFVDTERASFLEMHGQLHNEEITPKAAIERVERTEADLEESLAGSAFLAFGKWSEAGRLSSRAGDPAFFERDKHRRFAAWLLRNAEEQGLDEDVIQGVEKIRETVEESDSHLPFPDLEKQFAAILLHYQRQADAAITP